MTGRVFGRGDAMAFENLSTKMIQTTATRIHARKKGSLLLLHGRARPRRHDRAPSVPGSPRRRPESLLHGHRSHATHVPGHEQGVRNEIHVVVLPVSGKALDAGYYLAEERPEDVLHELSEFFGG
jgi:hypothetical protein